MDGPERRTTCTVIGAGLGGVALVANLGLCGYRMRLHDIDRARLAPLEARGGVDVEGTVHGFAPLELVTADLGRAVHGADLIIVVTGSTTHAEVAGGLSPLLQDGQTILLIQGGTGGSLIVRRELRHAGCSARVDVAEMDNYPYSLGWPAPTRMQMTITKRFLQIASLPSNRIEAVMGRLGRAFPQAVGVPSILHTGLNNMNAMLHVGNMVANSGRLESGGRFRFYSEGYTPSIVRLLETADTERLAVARAYGVSLPGVHEWLTKTYGFQEPTLADMFSRLTSDSSGPYQWTPTPPSMQHKYVLEDAPCGLVPMAALGRVAGVATPVIHGLVAVASAMTGHDFAAEGRTLERLGLTGRSVREIQALVESDGREL